MVYNSVMFFQYSDGSRSFSLLEYRWCLANIFFVWYVLLYQLSTGTYLSLVCGNIHISPFLLLISVVPQHTPSMNGCRVRSPVHFLYVLPKFIIVSFLTCSNHLLLMIPLLKFCHSYCSFIPCSLSLPRHSFPLLWNP